MATSPNDSQARPSRSHTALVVICITLLALTATITGSFLLWKGFAGGGELVMTLNTAISGLIGFLGGRMTNTTAAAVAPPITADTISLTNNNNP